MTVLPPVLTDAEPSLTTVIRPPSERTTVVERLVTTVALGVAVVVVVAGAGAGAAVVVVTSATPAWPTTATG